MASASDSYDVLFTGENITTNNRGTPTGIRQRELRKELNKLIHPNIPGKIYNSMHGGHFDFTSDDTKKWKNNGLSGDPLLPIELATAIVPDNLFVIHFYRLNTVGYGDKGIEICIRKSLPYVQSWITKHTNLILDEIPLAEQLEKATLSNSGHLYYPGESMYNSKLSFDWGKDSSNVYDVFNLDDPRSTDEERKYMETDPLALAKNIGRRPLNLAKKIENNDGKDYLDFIQQEKGKTFSQLAAINFISNYTNPRNDLFKNPRWKKNHKQINRISKDDISMQQFLNYISANTERGKKRVVFIFNCDPFLNSTNTTRALRHGRVRTTDSGDPIMDKNDYNTITQLRIAFNKKGVDNLRLFLKSTANVYPRAAMVTGSASEPIEEFVTAEGDTPRFGQDPSPNTTQRDQYVRDYRGKDLIGEGSGGNWLGNSSDKCWWEF